LKTAMAMMSIQRIFLKNFIFFIQTVVSSVFAQSDDENSSMAIYLESVLATIVFLLFLAVFLAFIWCVCCMGNLYEIDITDQNKSRRSISEDNV